MTDKDKSAADLLKERLARGEITPSEFDEIASRLSGSLEKRELGSYGGSPAAADLSSNGDAFPDAVENEQAADELLGIARDRHFSYLIGAILLLTPILVPLIYTITSIVIYVIFFFMLGSHIGWDISSTDPDVLVGHVVAFVLLATGISIYTAVRGIPGAARVASTLLLYRYLKNRYQDSVPEKLHNLRMVQAKRTGQKFDYPFDIVFTNGTRIIKGLEFGNAKERGWNAVPSPVVGRAVYILTLVMVILFILLLFTMFSLL